MAFENVVKYALWSYSHIIHKLFVRSYQRVKLANTYNQIMFNCPPRTAYFKKSDNGEYFSVVVRVEHKPSALVRKFEFYKRLESPVSRLLESVDHKVSVQLEKKLKKNSDDTEVPEVNSTLFKDKKRLSGDLLCETLFQEKGKYELEILNDSYFVIFNAPWVDIIDLPKKILSSSVIVPRKFQASYTDMEKSCFTWFRSAVPAAYTKTAPVLVKDWVKVGDNYFYRVQDDDVGHYLKIVCVPQNADLTGPEFIVYSSVPVAAARNDYYFVKTHSLTKNKVTAREIRIVTYNILAHVYTTSKEAKEIFDYCSAEALNKEDRYAAISREIADYNADIICLQEVESSTHREYIGPTLEYNGFGSIFYTKANEKEGTACYYNKNKFNFISSERFIFGQEIINNSYLRNIHDYLKQNQELFTKFIELPHILQMVVLNSSYRLDQILLIGNVHLFSYPDADLIRLIQVICSFYLFEYTAMKLQKNNPQSKITFVLCGDFNSTPECSINQLIMEGSISADNSIWSNGETTETSGISYKLPVNMKSAFENIKFTNYTRAFKGCLDYIYYQSDGLKVNKTYPLPDEDVLSADVGLPSIFFPSDHLPLIADMEWKT